MTEQAVPYRTKEQRRRELRNDAEALAEAVNRCHWIIIRLARNLNEALEVLRAGSAVRCQNCGVCTTCQLMQRMAAALAEAMRELG